MSYEFHCQRCGASNEIEQERTGRFSSEVGWPIYRTRYRCPNRRWPFDSHTLSGWSYRVVDPQYETTPAQGGER